jgi:hypothetical protein
VIVTTTTTTKAISEVDTPSEISRPRKDWARASGPFFFGTRDTSTTKGAKGARKQGLVLVPCARVAEAAAQGAQRA